MLIPKIKIKEFFLILVIFLNERMLYLNPSTNSLHVYILLLITFVSLILCHKTILRKKFSFKLIVILYVLINILSIFITVFNYGQPLDLAISRYKYIFVILLYFPIFYMVSSIGTIKVKNLIITLASVFSFIYLIQAIIYPNIVILNVTYAERFGFTRFFDGAFFITLGLFVTLDHIYNFKKNTQLKYYVAFILQLLFLLLVAQTRSTILPIVLIILIVIASKINFSKIITSVKSTIVILTATILISPLLINILTSLENDLSRSEGTAYIRMEARDFMLEGINKSPLLGVGLYNNEYDVGKQIDGKIYKFYAEDIGIIGLAFQYGFFGAFLYLIFLIQIFYLAIKIYIKEKSKSILYISFALYLISQVFSTTPFNVDNNLIYIVLFMGLIQKEYYDLKNNNK